MNNIKALMRVEWLLSKRNKMSIILGIGMPLGFFIFFTNIWQFDQQSLIRTLISMAAFSSMSFAIFTFPASLLEDKQTQWTKRLMNTPVTLVQYYIVRVLRLILNFFVAIVIVLVVGRWLKDIHLSGQQWLMIVILLLFGSICMIGIGIVLTLISSNEILAIVSNISYMLLGIVGGLWFPLEIFPKWLQAIGHWTPSYHVVNLVTHYLMNQTINLSSIVILLGYSVLSIIVTYAIKKFK